MLARWLTVAGLVVDNGDNLKMEARVSYVRWRKIMRWQVLTS